MVNPVARNPRPLVRLMLALSLLTLSLTTVAARAAEILTVELPAAPAPLVVTSNSLRLESPWQPPVTRPAAPNADAWQHSQRSQRAHVLGGHEGSLTTDVFTAEGMTVFREAWQDRNRDAFAVRLRLRNTGRQPIHLDRLVPLACADQAGLLLLDTQAGDWAVLIQERLKNGKPRSLRPRKTERIECDPFCLIRAKDEPGAPTLLVGSLSQLGLLSQVALRFRADQGNVRLESLQAEGELDGITLPAGGERASQWVYLQVSDDAPGLMADFADRMGAYHGVGVPPRNAPSVWCSWYYYGPDYTEALCREDLAALEKEHVPFDVFLIDECWAQARGDWWANDQWPGGMKAVADRIRAAGYVPGLWTCPYLAHPESRLAKEHPEWLLHLADGKLHTFAKGDFVLDPTYPGVCEHLENEYRRMARDWGYTYHKMDFMRSVFLDKNVRLHNPTVTRLEAYRMGLEVIRRGMGPDVYVSVCGGHYGGTIGLADSQRSGSDVGTAWKDDAIKRFKQNILRSWMGRLWHTDADAMTVRIRETDDGLVPGGKFRLGQFSDDEARTVALNQYLAGGLVCLTERFQEMGPERKELYHHVIPSINASSIPLDPIEEICPSQMLTRITPFCPYLAPWVTLTVINWSDEPQTPRVTLSPEVLGGLPGPYFLVSEFFSQEILGIYEAGASIELPPQAGHASRVLHIAPWNGIAPVLAGTDLHVSGGGVEISSWRMTENRVDGMIDTPWHCPVRVTVAFPSNEGFTPVTVTVPAGARAFSIDRP